jgi:hypothetical protein
VRETSNSYRPVPSGTEIRGYIADIGVKEPATNWFNQPTDRSRPCAP